MLVTFFFGSITFVDVESEFSESEKVLVTFFFGIITFVDVESEFSESEKVLVTFFFGIITFVDAESESSESEVFVSFFSAVIHAKPEMSFVYFSRLDSSSKTSAVSTLH